MSFIAAAIIGAAGIGGSIYSANMGADASRNAADAQMRAAQLGANTQLDIFHQTQSALAPYNQVGQSALQQLARMFGIGTGGPTSGTAANAMSALTQYPGYQFGLNQGQTALDRSAASRGLLLSGGQLKDSQQFGQQYGMQQGWQPYMNQLSGLASLGENAGAMTGQIGAGTGANVANSQLYAGQAQASGIMGSNNAWQGGIQSGLQNALYAYQRYGGGGGGYGSGGGYYGGTGGYPSNYNTTDTTGTSWG
jgi:hypothetical protein